MRLLPRLFLLICAFVFATAQLQAQDNGKAKPRARDLGIPFDGTPGALNAITDVAGVTVGHTTLISGEGKLVVGQGPVRTGVTAVLPRGKNSINDPVFAGWWSLNGNGEMTGTTWIEESGFLTGPVMITNTHSVGVVRDAAIQWRVSHGKMGPDDDWWSLPVVAETWDGWLNDINGFHVKPEHAFHAIDSAAAGPVKEGASAAAREWFATNSKAASEHRRDADREIKGATTRSAYWSSAILDAAKTCDIAGVPVGREIPGIRRIAAESFGDGDDGSIIVVVATDAPLVAHQLKRVARRVSLALGATWQHFRQRFRRHIHRLFYGQSSAKPRGSCCRSENAA